MPQSTPIPSETEGKLENGQYLRYEILKNHRNLFFNPLHVNYEHLIFLYRDTVWTEIFTTSPPPPTRECAGLNMMNGIHDPHYQRSGPKNGPHNAFQIFEKIDLKYAEFTGITHLAHK